MLILSYEGWYQCRLATDPDPTDEPWGITGGTFAGPGEPPLDRKIRLNDPVALRFPFTEAEFGVTVRQVARRRLSDNGAPTDTPLPDHPLVGARLSFLEDAMYHQRNNIIVEGLNSPIDPFHIRIRTPDGRICISRRDEWDITRPGLTINDVFMDPALTAHRKQEMEIKSPRLVEITGITDYTEFWQDRRAALAAELENHEPGSVAHAGLSKRIRFIDETRNDIGTRVTARQFLGLLSTYTVPINGAARIEDPDNRLGGRIGTSQDWPMVFWMGSYDVDTLCGYMKGTLDLPFYVSGSPSAPRGTAGPG